VADYEQQDNHHGEAEELQRYPDGQKKKQDSSVGPLAGSARVNWGRQHFDEFETKMRPGLTNVPDRWS
jgi:hypothetical protein